MSEAGTHEIGNLDCLRTFAVLAVLYDHWSMMHHTLQGWTNHPLAGEAGHIGVLAFFVHTSLVLMLSLERMSRSPQRIALRFYVRRFFRIYPLSILCVASVIAFRVPVSPLVGAKFAAFNVRTIVMNLLLAQNLLRLPDVSGPLWSLPFEVQMYVLLPPLFLLAIRPKAWKKILGVWVCAAVVGFACQLLIGHANFFGVIPCFLGGVLAYTLRGKIRAVVPAAFWPFVVFGWFVLATDAGGWFGKDALWPDWLACLLLGAGLNLFRDSKTRWLNRVTALIARYSYGIYLWHFPAMWALRGLWPKHETIATILWLLATALISALVYHLVEEPLIHIGRKLTDARKAIVAVPREAVAG